MTSGVVTIGRKKYAVGLYWENSPSGRISQAAKDAARQSETPVDYFVTRSGNEQGRVPQFGLAPRNAAFKGGLPSLAGCLATQQPGSWVGAFRLREGSAVVIVRDDLIVPDGDLFFEDESEARDRLYQEIAIGGFQRIYAPEAWGVPNADTMPIGLLLNDRADIRLRAVALSKEAKIVLGLGAFLLLAGFGFSFYLQEQRAAEAAARRARMAAMERARIQAQGLSTVARAPEYPPPERKWEKRPEALLAMEACHQALSKVSIAVTGWKIVGLRCDDKMLTIRWSRYGSFTKPPEGASVTDNGGAAVSVVSFNGLKPRGPQDLVDPDVVLKRYLRQSWTGTINRIADDPLPRPPQGHTGEWNPPPPPWVKRSFTFSVPVLPWTIPDFLRDIPGVVINSMTLNGSGISANETWTVEGVIYENRR